MEKKITLPKDIAERNKCFLCKNILSVPPIVSITLKEEKYKCGRCEQVKITAYSRNKLFENTAQFLIFPCTYSSCKAKIPWGLVESHEKNCIFKTIKCPIYYQNCDEVIEIRNLESHFKKKHPHNIQTFGKEWNLSIGYDYVYLTMMDNLDFLVYILHLDEKYLVKAFSFKALTKYTKFNVKLTSGGSEGFSVVYENQFINYYDERKYCYKCIRGLCDIKYHPSSIDNTKTIDFSVFTKLKKSLITSLAADIQKIKYKVNLITEVQPTKENEKPQNQHKYATEKSADLRQNVECPICAEYLVAPIYICKSGHTICNVCKPKLKKCPSCQVELSDTRNYTLEAITETIELHCDYKNNGCRLTGNTKQIYAHGLECKYKNKVT